LEGEASAEVRTRIKRLLDRLGAPEGRPPSADLIRLRAVEALEANGSKEARMALATLAKESTDAELRREAKASLERLSGRPASVP
jgi:HEAT repeat protein